MHKAGHAQGDPRYSLSSSALSATTSGDDFPETQRDDAALPAEEVEAPEIHAPPVVPGSTVSHALAGTVL